uniref:Hematopoietic cell-specific Lyn substrate 1 n=1 Tax=Cyclopterus lumpus TaxID=8103 RepID=A0A8C3AZ17_CYCLU
MWKSAVGHNVSMKVAAEGDDWETDPDFENDVSEQEQRWGAKTVEGSGRKEHISVAELRNKVAVEHEQLKQKDTTPKASYGYGGKFGVERDRMDKVALGNDYVAQVEQHSSQKDAARGFGGKFGVQKDRVDKVMALGYDYKGETEKHQSQKDYSKGFGGKYGVEKEKVDKVALGYDYKGETEKHQSQKDYSKGFGGKFGVEKEKVDKAALGYDYKSETEKHQSQKDYSAGFGGRYGVQADRMDKSAAGFSDMDSPSSAYKKTQPVEASGTGAGKLKARFENMAKASDEENKKKVEEERERRQARESREREVAKHRQEVTKRARENVHVGTRKEVRILSDSQRARQWSCEEPDYDEPPPTLPPRSDDFLDAPQLPNRSAAEEEDDGEYEDLVEPPPAPPTGLCQLSVKSQTSYDDHDYEDLSSGTQAVAIYDYEGEAEDEISFSPDDVITHIEMIDEGWWKGQCHGRIGLFPAAYVQLMP